MRLVFNGLCIGIRIAKSAPGIDPKSAHVGQLISLSRD
jgi:hypothetical protein